LISVLRVSSFVLTVFSLTWIWLFRWRRGFQLVEAAFPGRTFALHPGGRRIQRGGIEREEMVAPGDAPAHQARALEDANVLGNRIERNIEGRGDLGDARIAVGEPLQDAAPRLVRERDQGVVQFHAANINLKG
jgi:hypothetical protein